MENDNSIDWLPKEAWEAYLDMRKKKGKQYKATEYAQKLLINKLSSWRLEGHDIEAIINQSIERSWTGLFPVKQDLMRIGNNLGIKGQETANSMREWLGEDEEWKIQTNPNSRH